MKRILLTYLVPLVPAFVMWDGVVSVLRTYKVDEIKEILSSIPASGTYEWSIESRTLGQVTVFHAVGYPRQPD